MNRILINFLIVWVSLFLMGANSERTDTSDALIGKSLENILNKYGKPGSEQIYEMSQAQNEFRIELQNTYPLSDPANRKIKIRELSWLDKENVTTIWFHQKNGKWRVLNILRWEKNTDF